MADITLPNATSSFYNYSYPSYKKVVRDITKTTREFDDAGNLIKETEEREIVTEEVPNYPWYVTTTNSNDIKFG